MRALVGTMCCGEGDFEECHRMICAQRDVELIEHFVVRDKREREAHDELWSTFEERKHEFDLLVKIDADTVLRHDRVITEIGRVFRQNAPRLTGLQLPIFDFFTNKYINGLNAFTPRVLFSKSTDDLFVDRVDTGHDVVLKWNPGDVMSMSALRDRASRAFIELDEDLDLVPAAFHCMHANDAQAFHFGLHRALKGQTGVIEHVRHLHQATGERRRALVLLGASMSPRFKQNRAFSYSDPEFTAALDEAREILNDGPTR